MARRFLLSPSCRRFPSSRSPPSALISIDDAATTEIDDAFSVRPLANGHIEIGIHIAAPAVAIPRGSALDAIARKRLSTVYMPGRKITMLPDAALDRFTLRAGTAPPALSLYVEAAPDGTPLRTTTRLECVPVAANLRLDAIGERFAAPPRPMNRNGPTSCASCGGSRKSLRQRAASPRRCAVEYSFRVDWAAAPDGRVAIVPRPRGSPLDRLVAELMIYVNSSLGKAPRRRAGARALSHAAGGQGEDEHQA